MNERIKEIAQRAGISFSHFYDHWVSYDEELERFAELVRQDERNLRRTKKEWSDYERAIAADEREACAKLCEEQYEYYGCDHIFAAKIRGRTE